MQTCELRDSMEGLRLEANDVPELRVFQRDRELFFQNGNFAQRVFLLLSLFQKKLVHPEDVDCHGMAEFPYCDRTHPRKTGGKKGTVMSMETALRTIKLPFPMQLQTKDHAVHSAIVLCKNEEGEGIVLHKPGSYPVAIRLLSRMLRQFRGEYSQISFADFAVHGPLFSSTAPASTGLA